MGLAILMDTPSSATASSDDRTTMRVMDIIKRHQEFDDVDTITFLNQNVEGGCPGDWMDHIDATTTNVCVSFGAKHYNTLKEAKSLIDKLRMNRGERKLYVFKDRTTSKTFFPLPTRMSRGAIICILDDNYLDQIILARKKK